MFARGMVTDGGLETDLIFHRGMELPGFAAFPLHDDADGRAVLADYFAGYAAIAREADAGLLLESATWRANPDWAAELGYDTVGLDRVNRASIGFMQELRERFAVPDTVVSGTIGPRGDGYRPGDPVDPDDATDYHRAQLESFAAAGADLAGAYTLTDPGEAIGIVRAARSVGLPIAISFTVETDGRLPDGTTLAAAMTAVDAVAPPEHYLVNCAHPAHIARAFEGAAEPGNWTERIHGLRANASRQSHAELDEASELDDGDPRELAAAQAELEPKLANLAIIGGCCGTDARHVAALWGLAG